ncbi:hypothetical protein V5O48_000121 [Marasmius crinis-equi]|uniref:Uncharacterized protein n=1 Tax=Marasmius crinis-equi TaxID=585013 RepID=A0ABR3G227_9AGAR
MASTRLAPPHKTNIDYSVAAAERIKRSHSPDIFTDCKRIRETPDNVKCLVDTEEQPREKGDAASIDGSSEGDADRTMVDDEMPNHGHRIPTITQPPEDEIDRTHFHFAACPRCSPMAFGPPFSPATLERASTVARLRALLYSTTRKYQLQQVECNLELAEVVKERDQLRAQLYELTQTEVSVKEEIS